MPFYLDPQKEQMVVDAIRSIEEAEDLCRRASAAGFDMQAQNLACQYYRDQLARIREQLARPRRE